MLSGGELAKKYAANFVMIEADPGSRYPEGHELRLINDKKYTPVMVFLDTEGKSVYRTTGFSNANEAHALCEFVAKRHYKTTTFAEYRQQYKDK